MKVNEALLEAIKARSEKLTEFGYGILTADKYVRTLMDVVGLDICYRYGAKGSTSFSDVIEKAARTLVYSNPDMEVLEKAKDRLVGVPAGVELPKNTLMVFKHTLTTSREDRDGDILRSEGMEVDPKMLMLWQHVHTMPIGKYLATAKQDEDSLECYSAIVDINELSHDSAVMVDNGMGRFSHGFRAKEYEKMKSKDEGKGGFDVKRGEIMEESLVSVPANVDADTQEVILSLVEGGKLTSGIMKSYGRSLRDARPLQLPVSLDLKVTVNGQEVGDENKSTGGPEGREKGTAGTPEEADDDQIGAGTEGEGEAGDKEVNCPHCGEKYAPPGGKPYPNEHAARMSDPGRYVKVRRQNDKFGPGIHAIFGISKDGKTELQSIRFSSNKFSAEEARRWLTEHDYEAGSLEPAKKPKEEGKSVEDLGEKQEKQEEQEKKIKCPKCGYSAPLNYWQPGKDEYLCPKCKTDVANQFPEDWRKEEKKSIKLGRTLSKTHEGKIRDAKENVDEAHKMDGVPRAGRALLNVASRGLDEVLSSLGNVVEQRDEDELEIKELTAREAMAVFLAKAGAYERNRMMGSLKALDRVDKNTKRAHQYRKWVGKCR